MTGDQQWPSYEPSGSRSETPEPVGSPPRGGRQTPRKTRPVRPALAPPPSGSKLVRVLVFGAAPVALVAGVGTAMYVGSDRDGVFGAPDAQSAEGLEQLLDDIERHSGGTDVFRAVIYPEYAVVDLPVDATSQREESFSWDGDLTEFGGKGTSTETRVDLTEVDAELMTEAIATAKSLVEQPTSWYVIIDGPSMSFPDEDGPTMTAYASNEYQESAFVELTFDGVEIRRVLPS